MATDNYQRVTIYIEPDQAEFLKKLARKVWGCGRWDSRSAAVRYVVNTFMKSDEGKKLVPSGRQK